MSKIAISRLYANFLQSFSVTIAMVNEYQTRYERADLWLLFVVSNCEFVTFPLVSLVRCGT